MSVARRVQFATSVESRKPLVRPLQHAQGHVGHASRIGSRNGHRLVSGILWLSLAERLVGPETHDGQTEGVHGELIVLHVLAKDIGDAGCPSLPLEFAMIGGVGVNLLELDARRIRRLSEVVKDDVLDLDIDIRQGAVFDVVPNAVVLALLVDDGALHIAIEEVERLRLITFDGETIAAEIQLRPPSEVILVLRLLRAILKVPIVDRFRVAYVIDPYNHWVHVDRKSTR